MATKQYIKADIMANTQYPRTMQFIKDFASYQVCNDDLTNTAAWIVVDITAQNKFWQDIIAARPMAGKLTKLSTMAQHCLAAVDNDLTILETAQDLTILETALAKCSAKDIKLHISGKHKGALAPLAADEVMSSIMQTLWDAEDDVRPAR